MAKRIRGLDGIEEEHETDQCPIDGCRSIALGKQGVAIGFRIGCGDLADCEARMLMLQPGGKASGILRVEGDGFGRKIRTRFQGFLPVRNLLPHGSSLLSAEFHYQASFSRDRSPHSADNIPQEEGNCADKLAFRHSSTNHVSLLPRSRGPVSRKLS